MADVSETISCVHWQRLVLRDHEHVDDASRETLITIALENHQLKEPPGDLNWKASILTTYPYVLEYKIIESLNSHPQHDVTILFKLVG